MYLLSRFFGDASKLWRTKDFGVDEIEGGSTGTWLPENVSATKQILHFQNKKNYTKTFFFWDFSVLLGLDNMVSDIISDKISLENVLRKILEKS